MNNNPTNLSVNNCYINKTLDLYNKEYFNNNLLEKKQRFIYINPQVIYDNISQDFIPINHNYNNSENNWISNDPRLLNAAHGQQMLPLDRPPLESIQYKLNDLAHITNLDFYGQNYKTYNNINAGQILYYTDTEIENAFFSPNFVSTASPISFIYKDPMGSIKPQYFRIPINNNNLIGQFPREKYPGGLSFIDDSTNHREDIMSLQMSLINRQRWDPRWK